MKQSRPLKFGIGLFAGLCASLFPRLVAELTTPDTGEALVLFSNNYLLLSLVFSIFIGVVITIFEWETSRSPKDIFMSALAVPAILSGALNTTATVSNIKQLSAENSSYQQAIQSLTEIPTLPPSTLTPVTGVLRKINRSSFNFTLVPEAHAATANVQPAMNYSLGVIKVQPNYMVVLGQANSKQEAEQKATVLRSKTPVNIYRKSNNTYIITTTSGQQNKAKALSEAVRLKQQKGIQTSLQEVQ